MVFPAGPHGEPSIFVLIYQDYMRKQVARLTPKCPELGWDGDVLLETLALEPIATGRRPHG